jgi:hypothetical protein
MIGFVSTNSIAQGDTRETGLEYIMKIGGIIHYAEKFVEWKGEATVEVNLVAISKGIKIPHCLLDNSPVPVISSWLDDFIEFHPNKLAQNLNKAFIGDKARSFL